MASEREPARAEGASSSKGWAEGDSHPLAAPARISLIYESEDGRFCLFEDGDGHITAVRASALA